MRNLFMRSLKNKEKMMIFYLDNNNKMTQRVIRVVRIEEDAIIAFCFWRKQVRTFKWENILSAEPTGRKVGAS